MKHILIGFITLLGLNTFGQITLSGTSNLINFDNIGTGLPTGVIVNNAATATTAGNVWAYVQAPTVWNVTSNGVYNCASATGLTSASVVADQNASTNRALAIRQTASAGDPGGSFQFSYNNTAGFENFTAEFKLQSLDPASVRVTTFKVQYAIGDLTTWVDATTVPAVLNTGGSAFTNQTVTVNFGTALNNKSQAVNLRIVTLSATTGAGNRPTSAIDDFKLNYTAITTATPTISYGTVVEPAEPSTQGSITLSLNTPAPAGGISINYTLTSGASNGATATTDYTVASANPLVIAAGASSGTILINAVDDLLPEGPESLVLTLTSATGGYALPSAPLGFNIIDNEAAPFIANYLFNSCAGATLADGWSQQTVAGDSLWRCNPFNGFVGTNCLFINGYAATGQQANEDWFISPVLNLTSNTTPYVSFWSRTKFEGNALKMYVSTNYVSGAPSTGTWVELPCYFPPMFSDLWLRTEAVNLENYKTANTRIAFRYTNTATLASRWSIDNVSISNTNTPAIYAQTTLLDYGYQTVSSATVKTFVLATIKATGAVTLNAPVAFTLSKDNITFSNSLTYTLAETLSNQLVYVKYSPTLVNSSNAGYISSTGGGLSNNNLVYISGNTYTKDKTLDVVAWNIQWFGSTTSGQGPTDDNLAQANAKIVMDNLDADIYGMSEMVDTARLGALTRSLAGDFGYFVAEFCSLATNTTTGNYAIGQKNAFIYRKNMFSNMSVRGLLRTSTPAYTSWASGRFPYLLEADVTLNGTTKPYSFIVIHGKSGDLLTDYTRRKDGAKELKDTLDANFNTKRIILFGDFNDDLDESITAGQAVSSYDDIIKDSTDADSYFSATLPLSRTGVASTVSNPGMIDHCVISNEALLDYVPGSATLVTTVAALVSGYSFNLTDHYPVLSRFVWGNTTTAINNIAPSSLQIKLFPNPASHNMLLQFNNAKAGAWKVNILNIDGETLIATNTPSNIGNIYQNINVSKLAAGTYFLKMQKGNTVTSVKFIKLP
jgi:trimeric autotransporter adhesin